MTNWRTRLSMYKLVWSNSMLQSMITNKGVSIATRTPNRLRSISNMKTGVSIAARTPDSFDSMNEEIRSRGLYLAFVDVVDDGTMLMLRFPKARRRSLSSMSDGGRLRSSWRRIRLDAAPPVLDGRRPVVKILGAVAREALPKNLIRLLPVQDRKD